MLDKLTIVIPTHNRHHLLESRALPYFLEFGVHLLVIDSSLEPHLSSQNNPDIDYVHCPDEPLPHKMKKPVLERVKTPYMMMNADDTLASKQGIIDCISFLEKNPDYSSADGLVLQCYHDDKEHIGVTQRLEDHLIQADSDRAEERLLQNFIVFHSLFYAVQRTDCWKETFKRLPPEIVNHYLNETYMVAMTLLHGKNISLPVFFNATEAGPSLFGHDKRYYCSPHKLGIENRYRGEVEATKKAVSAYLAEQASMTEEKSQTYIEGALALYWGRSREPKTFEDRLKKEWNSFLNKTFKKKKFKELKAQKKIQIKEQQQLETEQVLEAIGEEGRKDFERLIKIVQTTVM